MTAPLRAPAPSRAPSRAPRGTTAAAPATLRRAGAAAPNRSAAAPNLRPVAPRPSLRLVDDRRLQVAHRRRRVRALLIATGLLVIASLFGVVICHAMLVSGQGRLDGVQQQVAEEQARYQAMRLQVAELEAPGRIVEEAQGRLGMVSPSEITYLTPVPLDAPAPDLDLEPAHTSTIASAPWNTVKPLLGGQG